MRKISFIMAALALVLGVTQCKKENKPLASGETQRIVLTASNGNDGSKVAVNETPKMLNLTWQDTDKIAASGAVEGTLAYKSDVEPGTATFEGSVTRKEGETVTFSIGSAPESFEGQTVDVTWIQNHLYLVGTADYNEEGVYGQDEKVEMQLQYAVLKLDLSALGTVEGTMVTISDASGTVATVTGVTTANKVYYVAMPAAASTTYTFSSVQGSVEKTWTLAANIFYTKNENGDAIVIEPVVPGTVTLDDVMHGPELDVYCYFTIKVNSGFSLMKDGVCYSKDNVEPDLSGSHCDVSTPSCDGYACIVPEGGMIGDTYYFRAYAIFKGEDGTEETVYSNVKTQTLQRI